MRRLSLPLVILVAVVIAALLAWLTLSAGSWRGRPAVKEAFATRAVGPFQRIDVSGHAEVTLVQGAAESVAIDVPARKEAQIDVEVRDNTLYIHVNDNERWWNSLIGGGGSRTPQVVVNFKTLDAVAVAGAVRIVARELRTPQLKITGAGGTSLKIDDLQTGTLRVLGAGALKAEVAGRATDQTVTIAGAGEYRGGKLASDNATVTVTGAGRVVVHAEKTLKATISGAGSVEYTGNPQVTEEVAGAGRVRKRDA